MTELLPCSRRPFFAVMPNGNLKYNSPSPDETALVSAAKNFGYVFKTRSQEQLVLEVCVFVSAEAIQSCRLRAAHRPCSLWPVSMGTALRPCDCARKLPYCCT